MKAFSKTIICGIAAALLITAAATDVHAQFVRTPNGVIRVPQSFPVAGNPYWHVNRNMAYYNPYNYVNPVAVNNFNTYSLPRYYNPYMYQAATPFAFPSYNPYTFQAYNPYLSPFGYGY